MLAIIIVYSLFGFEVIYNKIVYLKAKKKQLMWPTWVDFLESAEPNDLTQPHDTGSCLVGHVNTSNKYFIA